MFLGQSMLWDQIWRTLGNGSDGATSFPPSSLSGDPQRLQHCTLQIKQQLADMAASDAVQHHDRLAAVDSDSSLPSKRRRRNAAEITEDLADRSDPASEVTPKQPHRHQHQLTRPFPSDDTNCCSLPEEEVVNRLVDIYFAKFHPWIPMLHERQFRERMADPVARQKLTTIFYAIVSLCTRFSEDARLGDSASRTSLAKYCRQTVILRSMESFSVENLQALIVCAFDTVSHYHCAPATLLSSN